MLYRVLGAILPDIVTVLPAGAVEGVAKTWWLIWTLAVAVLALASVALIR